MRAPVLLEVCAKKLMLFASDFTQKFEDYMDLVG